MAPSRGHRRLRGFAAVHGRRCTERPPHACGDEGRETGLHAEDPFPSMLGRVHHWVDHRRDSPLCTARGNVKRTEPLVQEMIETEAFEHIGVGRSERSAATLPPSSAGHTRPDDVELRISKPGIIAAEVRSNAAFGVLQWKPARCQRDRWLVSAAGDTSPRTWSLREAEMQRSAGHQNSHGRLPAIPEAAPRLTSAEPDLAGLVATLG
jgi:hypothetical protein